MKKLIWPQSFVNQVICGDCLEVMKEMPGESVDMVITSPPYYGLRDYGIEQIFGGDKNCEHGWGREIDGKKLRGTDTGPRKEVYPEIHLSGSNFCSKCQAWKGQLGLEPTPEMYIEHLTEIFNEVKRVLKKEGVLFLNVGDTYASGSGGDRNVAGDGRQNPGKARKREQLKSLPPKCLCMIPERLAWSLIQNGWILRNKNIWHKRNAMPSSVKDRFSNTYEFVYMFSKSQKYYFDLDAVREPHSRNWNEEGWAKEYCKNGKKETHLKKTNIWALHGGKKSVAECFNPLGKNPGDVFEINTQPFPEAHFAVFPKKLCEKPIRAGCPEDGIVLDPFCGAGTALYVTKEMRRRYIGIDIKQEYCNMSEERLAQGVL